MAATPSVRSLDNQRVKGVSVVRPIIYGNTARAFSVPRPEDARTHEWTLYVRPYFDEDITIYIKKVQFKLHESYSNHTREPPFEVYETGWGEFEAIIKLYFTDSVEKPVTLYHIIRLFPINAVLTENNSIVSEVINEPTVAMQQAIQPLLANTSLYKHQLDWDKKIENTKNHLEEVLKNVNDELERGKAYINSLKEKIINVQSLLNREASDTIDSNQN